MITKLDIWRYVLAKIENNGVPNVVQWIKDLTSIHEDVGLIPALAQWVEELELP